VNSYEEFYNLAEELSKSDLLNSVCLYLKEQDSPEISKGLAAKVRSTIRKNKDLAIKPDNLLLAADKAIRGHFIEKVYGDIIQAAIELDKDYRFKGERVEIIIGLACRYEEHKSAGISWTDYIDGQGKMLYSIKVKAHKILLAAGFKKSTTTRGTEKDEPCRMVWRAPQVYKSMSVEDVLDSFDRNMTEARLKNIRK
jgi:hypothetical protein